MSLTEPIVDGAYYEREDGSTIGPARPYARGWELSKLYYSPDGTSPVGPNLTRRVYLVPVDPAEVVASLRDMAAMVAKVKAMSELQNRVARLALEEAADLVADKLGVGK